MDNDGGAQHGREVFQEVMIRECVALGITLILLWAIGPGRVLVPAWITKARAMWGRADPFEGQARAFASEISRWDHEQAAKADRKPAAGGPCGCG
jgi:hypothetical protein